MTGLLILLAVAVLLVIATWLGRDAKPGTGLAKQDNLVHERLDKIERMLAYLAVRQKERDESSEERASRQ